MADTKISNLAAVTTLGDTDEAVLAVAGASKKITGANLRAKCVSKSLYDANTVLAADTDDTPAAVTMGASTILARLAAGNIKAATPSELRTLLALVIGTNVQAWDNDLDLIAALATTAYGRSLLETANAGSLRSLAGLGAAAVLDVATPSVGLGSAAAAGSSANVIRADSTIAAFDTTVPSTQAFGDAAAIGTAAFAARRDHSHAFPADPTGGAPWTRVRKTADEDVASSTTPQNDDHIFFTATSGVVYEICLVVEYLSAAGGATPDLKFDLGEDATLRGIASVWYLTTGDLARQDFMNMAQGSTFSIGTATTLRAMMMRGIYVGGGATWRFRWSQATSGLNATTVKLGSAAFYRPIS